MSGHKGAGRQEFDSSTSTENEEDSILKQTGSGKVKKRKRLHLHEDNEFIAKVAHLVTENLKPTIARPVNTGWTNFNLLPPSTSVIGSVNTAPPVHFDVKLQKNDDNDSYGKIFKLSKAIIDFVR